MPCNMFSERPLLICSCTTNHAHPLPVSQMHSLHPSSRLPLTTLTPLQRPHHAPSPVHRPDLPWPATTHSRRARQDFPREPSSTTTISMRSCSLAPVTSFPFAPPPDNYSSSILHLIKPYKTFSWPSCEVPLSSHLPKTTSWQTCPLSSMPGVSTSSTWFQA